MKVSFMKKEWGHCSPLSKKALHIVNLSSHSFSGTRDLIELNRNSTKKKLGHSRFFNAMKRLCHGGCAGESGPCRRTPPHPVQSSGFSCRFGCLVELFFHRRYFVLVLHKRYFDPIQVWGSHELHTGGVPLHKRLLWFSGPRDAITIPILSILWNLACNNILEQPWVYFSFTLFMEA